MSLKEPQIRAGQACDAVLVDLALQGGGSHGAFIGGVLDRLIIVLQVIPCITPGASLFGLTGCLFSG
ncbi:hypothetical protein SAMN05216337_108310 [Bradyrhizobium brasilense]|uniref:Uncharacterized protein n=1 Tax=Bradyrhizobium brasilense TaxID=1419277 RepID=A0A1G7PR11_9BRAD|nr:hypothetical protein SAMN05216337_108310 [Bradyrhizobium brasilense]